MNDKIVGKVLDSSNIEEFIFITTERLTLSYVYVLLGFDDIHNEKKIKIIGEITNIESKNPYFENSTLIHYINENQDFLQTYSYYLVKAKIISIVTEMQDENINITPPIPGASVYLANENDISKAYDLKQNGIKIGFLKGFSKLPLTINKRDLLRTHFSVLGRTGAGKSYFCKGLLKNLDNEQRIVIISPSDEYESELKSNNFKIYKNNTITLPLTINYISKVFSLNLQEKKITELFFNNKMEELFLKKQLSSEDLTNHLLDWFENSILSKYNEKRSSEIYLFPEENIAKKNYLNTTFMDPEISNIAKKIDSIVDKFRQKDLFFSKESLTVPFDQNSIINLEFYSQSSQEIIINFILYEYLRRYRAKRDIDTLFIIEEIHNFAPSIKTTLCKNTIIQLSREGRKLGLKLGLVSQRPRFFDQTVLSQCGSVIVFHLPHPDDVTHAFSVSPFYSDEIINKIRKLQIGECYLIGDIVKTPMICQIKFL